MKGLLATIVIGAAVACVVYYLLDKEGAEELYTDLKDKAKGADDDAAEKIAGLKREANGVSA
ncbi:MAG TPA: hypothetical protein VFQ73_07825 [Flavisolibacter sp.]|nr:hypothetical protein [Flavisolibacter sp.]